MAFAATEMRLMRVNMGWSMMFLERAARKALSKECVGLPHNWSKSPWQSRAAPTTESEKVSDAMFVADRCFSMMRILAASALTDVVLTIAEPRTAQVVAS